MPKKKPNDPPCGSRPLAAPAPPATAPNGGYDDNDVRKLVFAARRLLLVTASPRGGDVVAALAALETAAGAFR